MVGDYLICESKPNETFYDGEIVLFEQSSGTVLRRITSAYPSYARSSQNGVNLGSVTSCGSYFTWSGNLLTGVCLMDTQTGELFVISEGHPEVINSILYPGNLLTWAVREVVDCQLAVTPYLLLCSGKEPSLRCEVVGSQAVKL